MASWATFEESAPELAAVADELWPGVVADLEEVDIARWVDVGQPGTRRRRWRPA